MADNLEDELAELGRVDEIPEELADRIRDLVSGAVKIVSYSGSIYVVEKDEVRLLSKSGDKAEIVVSPDKKRIAWSYETNSIPIDFLINRYSSSRQIDYLNPDVRSLRAVNIDGSCEELVRCGGHPLIQEVDPSYYSRTVVAPNPSFPDLRQRSDETKKFSYESPNWLDARTLEFIKKEFEISQFPLLSSISSVSKLKEKSKVVVELNIENKEV